MLLINYGRKKWMHQVWTRFMFPYALYVREVNKVNRSEGSLALWHPFQLIPLQTTEGSSC